MGRRGDIAGLRIRWWWLWGLRWWLRWRVRGSRWTAFWFVLVAMASHGLLDALTTGGRGVALLWPFSEARFFAPWRVIRVSPIGVESFLHGHVWMVVRSELLWVWVPTLSVFCVLRLGRTVRSL
ncbi:MAG: metal-dependent hydrolase [Acidobacteriota bacterium]